MEERFEVLVQSLENVHKCEGLVIMSEVQRALFEAGSILMYK